VSSIGSSLPSPLYVRIARCQSCKGEKRGGGWNSLKEKERKGGKTLLLPHRSTFSLFYTYFSRLGVKGENGCGNWNDCFDYPCIGKEFGISIKEMGDKIGDSLSFNLCFSISISNSRIGSI